ncbi:MAG: CRISPR-associated endonuclease Cas1 [Candidatus Sumerlaeia bacterium]
MDLIPTRMLNEHSYCPRLFYLMHVQGLWAESADTEEGRTQHDRAERRARARPPGPRGDEQDEEAEPIWPAPPRDLTLSDETLGIIGRLDALELSKDELPSPESSALPESDACDQPSRRPDGGQGTDPPGPAAARAVLWVPVDAKHGSPPEADRPIIWRDELALSPGAWPNDQVQLAAQGLLLRANGCRSEFGYVYYRKTRQRVRVDFTDTLFECVRREIAMTRATQNSAQLPPPLIDSPKCPGCSLHNICLPDETNWVLRRSEHPPAHVRPSLADAGVLYVSETRAFVGKKSDSIVVTFPDGDAKPVQIPWKDVAHVSLIGPVQASTQFIHYALEHGRSVSWLTAGGRYLGGAFPQTGHNFHLRRAQFALMDDADRRLRLARVLVAVKILNGRTLIRRNGRDNKSVLIELRRLAAAAHRARTFDELMGIEGLAARVYFPAFGALLAEAAGADFDWQGRSRRPPRDPINALLSLGYALLARDMEIAVRAVGLEPMAGFFHAPENGRPALALDLMEPFRPLLADSVALRLINTGAVKAGDFWRLPGQTSLKPAARKRFFSAWEQRMNETVRHPRFRYSISYRRILELEARLFARYLEGELPDYIPLTTR